MMASRRRFGGGGGGRALAAGPSRPLLFLAALAAAAAMLLVLPGAAAAAAADEPVDVCPAATFKKLPFLRAAKPDALDVLLPASLSGGFALDQAAIVEFAKTTLIPLVGANVFFFVLSALLLLIFVLWRLLRWCCHVLCCRGGCDARREANDPAELLFGTGARVLKALLFLFGLASVAFAVYGLATVPKNVSDQAFTVVQRVADYADGAFDVLDSLLGTIGGVPAIVDDLQLIVTRDIDVDGFTSNLTAVGTFLGAIPAPSAVSAQVSGLNTRLGDLGTALTAAGNGLTGFGAAETAFQGALTTVANAYTTKLSDFATKANAAETDLTDPVWATASPGPGAGAALTAIQNNLNAIVTATWVTDLTAIVTALTGANGIGAANPYAALSALMLAVKTVSDDVTATRVPALTANVNTLNTQYTSVKTSLSWLLGQLVAVNATVIALPADMQGAFTSLKGANDSLATVFGATPSPATLSASLTTFLGNMPSLTDVDALITALNSADASIDAAFLRTSVTSYAAAVSAAIGTLNSLASPLAAYKSALTTYTGAAASAGNWAALLAAKAAAQPLLVQLAGTAAGGLDNAALAGGGSTASAFSTTAGGAPWNAWSTAGSLGTPTSNAATYVTNAQGALATAPSLTALTTNMGAAATSFAALGTPASAVVDAPKQQLAAIKAAAVTSGDQVKQQVAGMVAGFSSSTAAIRGSVTGTLGGIRPRYQPLAAQVDAYRYQGSMALFGVSVLFVLLLLASALCHYHFGLNFSTFGLLVVTTLYLLLGALFALVLSALFMGCGEVEPLALRLAPASMAPLLRYYFYNEGASFSAVLKGAGLIDIDAVLAQATAGQQDVVAGITGTFAFRPGPAAVIARINTTIDAALSDVDALLGKASREQLFPLYADVKGLVCCAVPDVLGVHWTALTFAGVLAVAGVLAAFFFIGRIDRAPRRDCCGCTCHTRARYAATAAFPGGNGASSAGGLLPQYQTAAGFEQQQYVPPAVSLPWSSGGAGTSSEGAEYAAATVVVAPRGASATAGKKGR